MRETKSANWIFATCAVGREALDLMPVVEKALNGFSETPYRHTSGLAVTLALAELPQRPRRKLYSREYAVSLQVVQVACFQLLSFVNQLLSVLLGANPRPGQARWSNLDYDSLPVRRSFQGHHRAGLTSGRIPADRSQCVLYPIVPNFPCFHGRVLSPCLVFVTAKCATFSFGTLLASSRDIFADNSHQCSEFHLRIFVLADAKCLCISAQRELRDAYVDLRC